MLNSLLKEKAEKEIKRICVKLRGIGEEYQKNLYSLGSVRLSNNIAARTSGLAYKVVRRNDVNLLTCLLILFEDKMDKLEDEDFKIEINSYKCRIYSKFLNEVSKAFADKKRIDFKPDPTPNSNQLGSHNHNLFQ